MDLYSFGPIAVVLDGAYAAVMSLSSLLTPLAGTASAALAIVLVTLLVRAALIPVGVSQVRAANTRRRLAPKLAALQKQFKGRPEVLQRKTMELYRAEGISPTAGCLPLLLQLPVVSAIYALFVVTTVNGHANELLTESFLGMPLGSSFVHQLMTGALGLEPALMMVAIVAVIAVVAQLSRKLLADVPATQPGVDEPAAGAPDLARMMGALSYLPFVTAIVALFVPLAAALYITVTTAWTFGERWLLRRMLPADAA
ncbi:MAG TPA: membrane protein insertase YidC [Microbacterium sp.]|uniref:YidC/Oxa1 family membrane protein insertase n=1 Tax=Microbacterium sp. TaxID=51671 RepID=UPI002B8F370F|nr:membrane protein insertase YidC [Microbacterium sp.]HWI31024.1 membrane protein insertase YidC [Microbacterium sp.]